MCGAPAAALLRLGEGACAACLEALVLRRVKAAGAARRAKPGAGRARGFGGGDTVLVGVSGGLSSKALLHLLRRCLNDTPGRPCRGRVDFSLAAVRVAGPEEASGDGGAGALDAACGASRLGVPLLVVPLAFVFCCPRDLARAVADALGEERSGAAFWRQEPAALAVPAREGDARRLRALLDSLEGDDTAREDLEEILRTRLLLEVGRALGANRLALGHCASALAVRAFCDVAKARGYSLPAGIQYWDDRHAGKGLPATILPLRDCTAKEAALFCHFSESVGTRVLLPAPAPEVPRAAPPRRPRRGGSLNALVRDFLSTLQEQQPSTVTTVLRTAERLPSFPFNDLGCGGGELNGGALKLCGLCAAPLNPRRTREMEEETCHASAVCYSCDRLFLLPHAGFCTLLPPYFGSELGRGEGEKGSTEGRGDGPRLEPDEAPPQRRGARLCKYCGEARAVMLRPKTREFICRECFYSAFEHEVHETITEYGLFSPGDRVAVGASGGKDSTVLAHVLSTLNARHGYGLELFLVSVDEGITGYRDDSLETVKRNEQQYKIPLKVVSFEELYGWTMDAVVEKLGRKNNCTFCGVFRRQALDRGADTLGVQKIATGHNADDIAETVFLNLLRGDYPRLLRCTACMTGSADELPRVKPFKRSYQKEIVMYAYHKNLDYFATECTYSPEAYRGNAREFVKDLEVEHPISILQAIISGDSLRRTSGAEPSAGKGAPQVRKRCIRCGYMTSQTVCKACVLLEGLNTGDAELGVRKRGGKVAAGEVPLQAKAPRGPIVLEYERTSLG